MTLTRRGVRRPGADAVFRAQTISNGRHDECGVAPAGPLAGVRVWSARDADAREFALLGSGRRWTAGVAVNPGVAVLAAPEERALRIENWHRWLAQPAREPRLVQVAVVLDRAPDPGMALDCAMEGSLDSQAPAFALEVMREAARALRSDGSELSAYVFVTLTAAGPDGERSAADRASIDLGARLPALSRGLAATGAGEVRPVTTEELAAVVRGWFDPAVRTALAQVEAGGVTPLAWVDAGPVAAQERPGSYRHDSGLSRTYEMVRPPSASVSCESALGSIVAPLTDVPHQRVTLLYRPLHVTGAPGADLGVSLLVTVTAAGEPALDAACEAVVLAGRRADLPLRPVAGGQAAAFAAGLGLGVVPPWGPTRGRR